MARSRAWVLSFLVAGCSASTPHAPAHDAGPAVDANVDGGPRVLTDTGPRPDASRPEGGVDAAHDGGPGVDGGPRPDSGLVLGGDCSGTANAMRVVGDTDDPLTEGRSFVGGSAPGWLADRAGIEQVGFRAVADDGSEWMMRFSSPPGVTMATGTYLGVTGNDVDSMHGAMDVEGNHRGCAIIGGSFVVHEVTFSGSEVVRFRATFDQVCNDGPGHAIGCIAYTAP